ncbi:MAG TPA: 50S ribosomal protein L21 [Actinomycetota bacterium]|nr:50S ribosomal protein L21 [Actinomycetota bacterium]
MYAIVRTSGHQEKVTVGDEVLLNRVAEQPGSTVELSPVLLVVDGETVTSDPGSLSGAKVVAEVVEHKRGPKIDVFKYKNKTGYRRRQGHRQEQTVVKVTGIELGA